MDTTTLYFAIAIIIFAAYIALDLFGFLPAKTNLSKLYARFLRFYTDGGTTAKSVWGWTTLISFGAVLLSKFMIWLLALKSTPPGLVFFFGIYTLVLMAWHYACLKDCPRAKKNQSEDS